MLKGFEPIISTEPYLLILGSMPGVISLEKQEYYGHVYNRFWKFMQMIYHMPIDTYKQKKAIIYCNHLILWDVIGECEREGSLDSKIRKEKVNDIAHLVQSYPSLKKVICNGRKSYDLYQKYFSALSLPCEYVPSTSNANRSIQQEVIFNAWKEALEIE